MKNKQVLLSLAFIASILFFSSCEKNTEKPRGEFSAGVFIVNEGNFGSADGTITFYEPNSGEVKQDIFGTANDQRALGDVVQSITISGEYAYVVVNNSNKVEVVEADNFKSVYTLEDVELPRYMIMHSGLGFLTEWVSFSQTGRVSVINLNNRDIQKRITTGFGAEGLLIQNGKLYVTNSFTNTVSVINLTALEVTRTIEVGQSPGALVADKDGKVWVICGGGYDANFSPLNDGAFYKINPNTDVVESSIPINTNVSAKMAINKNKDIIYYYRGKSIFALPISASIAPSTALITENEAVGFYGIGFNDTEEIIYASDAKGFVANGEVYRYNTNSARINTFAVGRGPNGFVFK